MQHKLATLMALAEGLSVSSGLPDEVTQILIPVGRSKAVPSKKTEQDLLMLEKAEQKRQRKALKNLKRGI